MARAEPEVCAEIAREVPLLGAEHAADQVISRILAPT
jgi:hypothetical protein